MGAIAFSGTGTYTQGCTHSHVHTHPFHEPPLALCLPLRPGQTTWLWPGDLGTVRTGRRSPGTGYKLRQRAWRSGDGARES